MYVYVNGSGKYRVIQFREDIYDPTAKNKKRIKTIKTLGNYEAMLAENPNIIAELKEEAKRLTIERRAERRPAELTLENQELTDVSQAAASYHFGHVLILRLWNQL